jgi:hypothetical protein
LDKIIIIGKYQKKIILDENRVTIIRDATAFNGKFKKVILFQDMLSVDVKEPATLNPGYIAIRTADFNGIVSDFSSTGGSTNAAFDENAVVFKDHESYKKALQIQKFINEYKVTASQSISIADEIIKFKQLLDSGAITEEEYMKAKQKILDA